MTKTLDIALLLCGGPPPGCEGYDGDYLQMFTRLFGEHAPDVAIHAYDVRRGDYPGPNKRFAGYLSSGSACSVFDGEPWIEQYADYVRDLHRRRQKHFGVCFGHQMIAHALGGKVERSERGWGVGVQAVDVVGTKPWMQPPLPQYNLIVSHQDQVVRLPTGAEVLASNAHCPIAMFAVGDDTAGIQAHPEFRPVYAAPLLRSRRERVGAAKTDAALQTFVQRRNEREITLWMRNFWLG